MQMEDSSYEDSDMESPVRSGGKKSKMNDGSSRYIFEAPSDENRHDEIMESGMSDSLFVNIIETRAEDTGDNFAGSSLESRVEAEAETNTSDDTRSRISVPVNEIVILAPSTSGAQAVLVNIIHKSRIDRYEASTSLEEESDRGSTSSQNYNDFYSDETPSTSRQDEGIEIGENDEDIDSDDFTTEGDSMDLIEFNADDDDDDEEVGDSGSTSDVGTDSTPPAVLLKERPKHNYFIVKEILNRELGISSSRGKTTNDDVMFTQRFYSSLHAAFRMEKLHTLQKHRRCVNSLNFSPEGQLLVSGSDDTNVIVWDWARKIPVHTIENVHRSNIFQSKFLYLNSSNQLNIVTCARDGQVKLMQCNSAGGSWSRRRLATHGKAVNKLYVTPLEPHSVFSAGDDGFVLHCDLRVDAVHKLIHQKFRHGPMALNSVHGHPLNPVELVVAGRDKFVRVYDRRFPKKPVALYCPTPFTEEPSIIRRTMRLATIHLSCAVYNHDGTEILGSYTDDDIYLFNTITDKYNIDEPNQQSEGYSLRYSGHRNSSTLKAVTFYGPKSEYIISGSDCGHIYMWEKHSESIVQWLKADANGVATTVEPHPRYPIMASSGLDKDIKIWAPYSNEDPSYNGMKSTVTSNCAVQWQSPLFNDFLPTLYRSWRGVDHLAMDDENLPYSGNMALEANICTTI